MVRVTGFEPAASWSQTTRATSCATPGYRQKKLAPFRFRLAAKTAHALLPSSSPNRARFAEPRFGKRGRRNSLRSVSCSDERRSAFFRARLLYIMSRQEARNFCLEEAVGSSPCVFFVDVSFQLCYSVMRSVIDP